VKVSSLYRCGIKYLTVPNNSHLRDCACAISQSLVCHCFVYLIFISLVTVRFKVRVRVSCRVRFKFNNFHMSRKSCTASYLAMRHILYDTGTLNSGAQLMSDYVDCILLPFIKL